MKSKPVTFSITALILFFTCLAGNSFGFNKDDLEGLGETFFSCTNCDLSGADLSNKDLSGIDFEGTDFTDADLSNANLTGAKLTGAKLTGAILHGVIGLESALQSAEQLLAKEKRLAEARKALCSKKFPKEKDMIAVKGFYIGMNICDADKLMKEGKYKSVFTNNGVIVSNILSANNEGKVTKIYFKEKLLHDLFKSKDMSLTMFAENFGKHYIKGKFMYEMEPHNDFKNNNIGYKYYNGEVGYKFFIKQNESGTGAESLTIEEVAKVSEGFGD